MKIFFTSDTHYGHKNIIKYANRPFTSVEDMTDGLIKRWNEVVAPEDTVYHLGDFCWSYSSTNFVEIARHLNGTKFWVFGNHDKPFRKEKHASEIARLFVKTADLMEIKVPDTDGKEDGFQRIILCHYAMRIWNKSHYGSWQLYGHSHGTLPDDPNALSLDVGVDLWNWYPASYDQIKEKMKQKNFKPIDHHGREKFV